MIKLWKQEWKYHIFFIVSVIVILIISCDMREMLRDVAESVRYAESGSNLMTHNIQWYIIRPVEWMCAAVEMEFCGKVIWIVFGGLLVKKSMIYWIERNACGREFFQSLPIRKNERIRFHLLMDVLLVVICVVAYIYYEYSLISSGLEMCQLEMPWIGSACVGIALVYVSFMWMVLGWLYFIDSIWVSGTMKLSGFVGSVLMIFVVLYNTFDRFDESKIAQTLYGFFAMKSVGGNYYSLEERNLFSSGFRYEWVHDLFEVPILYKGEGFGLAIVQDTEGWMCEAESLCRLYDFTQPSTYVCHVIGYLLIGVLLLVISYRLSSKQELSKGTFYFKFGRYLFSGMMAVTFYAMIMGAQVYVWQRIVSIVAAIIVFVVLMYLLDEDRKPLRRHKIAG